MPRFLQYIRLPRINPAMLLVGLGVPVAVIAVLRWQFGTTIALAALGVILGIVLLVVAWRMFWRWRARRRARSLYDSLEVQGQRAADASAGEERARVAELRQRFDDALGEL